MGSRCSLSLPLTFVAVALSLGACSSDRKSQRTTELHVQWFFANGSDCATSHVSEILLRANPTGSDAIAMRAPCGDGSLVFPPDGQKMGPGHWNLLAQALDATGQSCFRDASEVRDVEQGDQIEVRIIFHKKTSGLSAVCEDIGEDIDGGVPEPDAGGEGEGEGEGELGVDMQSIGEPTWEPKGAVMFSIPTGDGSADGLAAAMNALLQPNHDMDVEGTVSWGPAHEGPYDTEISGLLETAGIQNKTEFTIEEFSSPSFLVWMFTLLPNDGGTTGSSPDATDGPILENALYPLVISGDLSLGDQVFDPAYDGQLQGMDVLEQPFDGFSHHPAAFFGNASTGPPEASLPGRYELALRILDSTGAGWNVYMAFRVD